MKTKCVRKTGKEKHYEIGVETLIERFKKIRALNCTDPHDVGLDGYLWKKFNLTTRSHLIAKMF